MKSVNLCVAKVYESIPVMICLLHVISGHCILQVNLGCQVDCLLIRAFCQAN